MPLILESPDGQQRLDLRFDGYEFPEIKGDRNVSNWLIIYIRVRKGLMIWSATYPALQTVEIEEWAAWLDALAERQPIRTKHFFLEPDLELRAMLWKSGKARLRIYFDAEFRPIPLPRRCTGLHDIFVDFVLTPEQLQDTARQLREELRRYPVRPWIVP